MPEKPKQFNTSHASIFRDASVVNAYHNRPTYPAETFQVLSSLIPSGISPVSVLDAGCGTGFIARPLAALVDQVDAVDISERMIAMAKTLPGGERANIRWIQAPIETAPLAGPYALIVAAASLHWMDWERSLPRFADSIVPNGRLALVEEKHAVYPWDREAAPVIRHYSLNQDFAPYNMATLAQELEQRRLFTPEDHFETAPVAFQQALDDYIASYHARNGFSLDRMDPRSAAQFDAALRAIVAPHCQGGYVPLQVSAHMIWGRPRAG